MNELQELQEKFQISESEANELFDIVNWVTSLWMKKKYGYPKDTPLGISLTARFEDEDFLAIFRKEIEEKKHIKFETGP